MLQKKGRVSEIGRRKSMADDNNNKKKLSKIYGYGSMLEFA